MKTVRAIYELVDEFAPFDTCMEEDSVGLLVGSLNAPVERVAVALDVTEATVKSASQSGCQLLVAHHPAYFGEFADQPDESAAKLAARLGLSVISAHTNLDAAQGGVNDCLASALGLANVKTIDDGSLQPPLLRIGERRFESSDELAKFLKRALTVGGVKLTAASGSIERIAVCGGSGGSFLQIAAAAKADALVTGESKHHERLLAKQLGITLAECGHFCTEQVVKPALADVVAKAGVDVVVLNESDPARYI